MTFEEWWDDVATKDAWVRAMCKEAWDAAWYEGLAEGNKKGKWTELHELLAKLNPKEYGDDTLA